MFVEVLQREFGEGEVIAFEILRRGEAEGGRRILVQGVEDFDPDVDVAVRFRPVAIAVVQHVRRVAGRRQ